MKKIIPLSILLLFVLQGLGAGDLLDTNELSQHHEIISFTNPSLTNDADGTLISFSETQTWVNTPGNPYMPAYKITHTYPFGTRIHDIVATFDNPTSYQIDQPIKSVPAPALQYQNKMTYADTQRLQYSIDSKYPAEITYYADSGIQQGEHVVYLNIFVKPFSYDPMENTAIMYQTVSVDILYETPEVQMTFPDEYDMVIIAPSDFSSAIAPLIDHKTNIGLQTYLKTTEEIYSEYTGVDEPEQIKYFIKDAIETQGIDYVLLIGGRNGGIIEEKWWVPVRYSHLDDGHEGSYISDLYYADIYNETGEFTDWDTNGNGIIAEWKGFKRDILGLYPDIYIGRLPCRNAREVDIVVEKIIGYETTEKDSWFYDMVVVGGDSAPGDTYNEGEEENKKAIEYMDGFTTTHCWTSDETFTGPDDVKNAIANGCGFLFFDGHANPASWSTHPPGDDETWITGLTVKDMPTLQNGNKFPVCVVGGCHIAQFNVSLHNLIRDIVEYGPLGYFVRAPFKFYHMEWVPKCWSWQLAAMKEGGSIATLGYTGLDWFAVGDDDADGIPDCTQYYSGFMNTHFFKNYGVNDITVLGQIHTQTVIDFINTHPPMDYELNCKTIQEFVLLGDPSLQLG